MAKRDVRVGDRVSLAPFGCKGKGTVTIVRPGVNGPTFVVRTASGYIDSASYRSTKL